MAYSSRSYTPQRPKWVIVGLVDPVVVLSEELSPDITETQPDDEDRGHGGRVGPSREESQSSLVVKPGLLAGQSPPPPTPTPYPHSLPPLPPPHPWGRAGPSREESRSSLVVKPGLLAGQSPHPPTPAPYPRSLPPLPPPHPWGREG